MSRMTKKQQKTLVRILAGAVLFVAAVALSKTLPALAGWWALPVYLVPYLVVGGDVLLRAGRNIAHGQIFDENFLMAIATVGSLCIGDFPEAIAVMLFYQVGEWFQSYAVGRSRQSIAALMDIRPDYANVEGPDGLTRVDPEEVAMGDVIVVKPGERVPLDGEVLEGRSLLDTSALTGESVPRQAAAGDTVISGCINQTGLLRVRVSRPYGESTVAKILELTENAGSKKAKAENFITKFARYYTPVVVIGAALLAVLPPLILGGGFAEWLHRALIFLVISCPCALVISIPLSFFGGIGGASRQGILIKGGNYLEALAKTGTVVFDKTGTLTRGSFRVTECHPVGMEEARLLELAALAESYSDHPISLSLKRAVDKPVDPARVTGAEEIAGRGVRAVVDGRAVAAGNARLMAELGAAYETGDIPGTAVHVAVASAATHAAASDWVYAGYLVISDEIKPDAPEAIAQLKALGVRKTVMLTGDAPAAAGRVAAALGLDETHAGLLPDGKVAKVEELLAHPAETGVLAFVGDGINDAPVLSRADVGIAMGGLGSDAAIEAADVVLMDDQPSKIAAAIRLSRRTLRIVRQNIVFALGVKLLFLALGAFGLANMWEAVFADVGVSVIAILNATRALRA